VNTNDIEILTEWTEADVQDILARQFDAITMAEQETTAVPHGVRAGQVYIVSRVPRPLDRPYQALPVLVVQNNTLNTLEPTAMVVRLTTQPPARWRDYSVPLPGTETGLLKNTVALCHQILTVPQTDCERLMGTIGPPSMHKVAEMLRWCLGLP
jgi:mRNA interferase MazF